MNRNVLWEARRWTGLEHLAIRSEASRVHADGLIIAIVDGRPVRLGYALQCDSSWRVRILEVEVLPNGPRLRLESDGEGNWRDESGGVLPALARALDVDISLTPFTNALPIRRLQLEAGQSRDIHVVYVDAPSLEVRSAEQRYTCIQTGPNGGRYLYESGSFRAELTVDMDGLVVDYAGLWRRAGESTPS